MPLTPIQDKQVVNVAIATTASAFFDLDVSGWSKLTLWLQLQGTTVATDGVTIAQVFKPDGSAVCLTNFPATRSTGFSSDGTNINNWLQYDISGVHKIRVGLTNNNALTKTGQVQVYLGAS